jgi:Beta-galactosidase/beta-glucuronidase
MAISAQEKPYWQDESVVAVNKEYPRTAFMSYGDLASAKLGKFENSAYYQLLNGTWKFYYVDGYKQLPSNITDASVDVASWHDIKVPGNWEIQGFGTPIYVNHGYEFKPRNPQPPLLPEMNPVGVYRRRCGDSFQLAGVRYLPEYWWCQIGRLCLPQWPGGGLQRGF